MLDPRDTVKFTAPTADSIRNALEKRFPDAASLGDTSEVPTTAETKNMSKPSSFEIELIQKIARAEIKLQSMKISHSNECGVHDSTGMQTKCTCGADGHNQKISELLTELKIK